MIRMCERATNYQLMIAIDGLPSELEESLG